MSMPRRAQQLAALQERILSAWRGRIPRPATPRPTCPGPEPLAGEAWRAAHHVTTSAWTSSPVCRAAGPWSAGTRNGSRLIGLEAVGKSVIDQRSALRLGRTGPDLRHLEFMGQQPGRVQENPLLTLTA